MPLRSIAKIVRLRRDKGHDQTEWLKQVCRSIIEKEGCNDLRARLETVAEDRSDWTESEEEAVQAYVAKLPELQRDILFRRRADMTPTKISRITGVDRLTVIQSLARIHADLRVLLKDARTDFSTTQEGTS